MAGDWIKFEMATLDKPEVIMMAELLDIEQDAVIGKLLRFWSWGDMQSQNGHALNVTKKFLDRLVYCEGFTDSLLEVGWLAKADGNFQIPNFERHNGKSAKKRALTAERKRLSRLLGDQTKDKSVTDVPEESRSKRDKSVTREEKRREEYITPISPKGESKKNAQGMDLDPLRVRIIRCITPHSGCARERDGAEDRAWKKISGRVRAEDVEVVERLYGLEKSGECDATWKRKTGVTQLMNQWTEQVELAREFLLAQEASGDPFSNLKERYTPEAGE